MRAHGPDPMVAPADAPGPTAGRGRRRRKYAPPSRRLLGGPSGRPRPYRLAGHRWCPSRYDLTLEPDLEAATFAGFESVDVQITRAGQRDPPERRRPGRSTDGWLEAADGAAARRPVRPRRRRRAGASWRCRPSPTPATWTAAPAVHRRAQRQASPASTARRSSAPTAPSTPSPPPSSRPPMPAGPFPAGTSRPSRRSSPSRSSCPRATSRCPTRPSCRPSRPATGVARVRFADTMPMSTYLVAFVVGPLEITEPIDVDGTPLRIVHPPGSGHLTAFALEAGAFCAAPPRRLLRHRPIPATSSTSSPSPTSPSGPWRTSAASPSARRCC